MAKTNKKNAFTLLELLIVITLVGILAVIVMTRYGAVAENARSAEAYAVLAEVAASESGYYVENNAYTTTWSNLDRYAAAPPSDNFTYTLNSGYYGKAAPKSGRGTKTYYMCFDGTNKGTAIPSCSTP
ncbi:MAG: type II secretion system protein [Candidatus Omnitrophota bacterium]